MKAAADLLHISNYGPTHLRTLTLFALALVSTALSFAAESTASPTFYYTKDLENAAHNSIHFEPPNYVVVNSKTHVDLITHAQTFYTVPAGKQLVIENFSATCGTGGAYVHMLAVYNNASGLSGVRGTAFVTAAVAGGGSYGSTATKLYAGPGAVVQFNALIPPNANNVLCSPGFTGYLLPAAQ